MESENETREPAKGAAPAPAPAPAAESSQTAQKLKYPKSVFFIISNEFCERFTFYGMRTVLALYLKNQLDFSNDTSTVIFHIFIMFCYFFPLLGAIIADSWLGKYRTILYLSVVYATGDMVVALSAIPSFPAVVLTLIGLVLIATGTGGIKPCVSAFGGDQFVLPQQESYLKRFFSFFYFTINAGSFISTLLTPALREVSCFGQPTCYTLAFSVPATLMVISIVIFVSGTKYYKIKKPEGNVVVKVAKCVGHAIKNRKKGTGPHWLDKASDKYDPTFISDVKAAFRVLVLYLPLPFFWALFDQQGSRWTFQASRMNGDIGSVQIQPDQMQVVNPVLILAFIPLFETGIYPLFAKFNLLKKPLQRLTVGGLLAALSFVVSAIVEYKLEETYAILPKPGEGQIRLYNTLPENLNIRFIDPPYDPVTIKSMNFWKKLDVAVKDKRLIDVRYTVAGTEKTNNFTVFENSLTSYIITPDTTIQMLKDDADKSKNGSPKVMIICTDATKETQVRLEDCKMLKVFTVSKTVPYTKYQETPDCDHYRIVVDGRFVKNNVHLQQGGVYVIFVSGAPGAQEVDLLNVIHPNSVHMLWLVPQYVIITAGEVMFSITGLEFSFTQAPVSMKALMQAAWLLTVAVGNLIVVIIAQSRVFERQLFEFLLFAALMTIDMIIFILMAMRYKYVQITDDTNKPEETAGTARRNR